MEIPAPDSTLLLLPGSNPTAEGVRLIQNLAKLDSYQSKIKLNTKLPLPLCPCYQDAILGELGDRLDREGIQFLAVNNALLDREPEAFVASRCDFDVGKINFTAKSGVTRSLTLDAPILIVECRYKEESTDTRSDRRFAPLDTRARDLGGTREISRQSDISQVLHLYQGEDLTPLVLIDQEIDYSSLVSGTENNALWNFRRLVGTLEQVFEVSADRRLVELPFAAQRTLVSSSRSSSARDTTNSWLFSNRGTTDQLSRLIALTWNTANRRIVA